MTVQRIIESLEETKELWKGSQEEIVIFGIFENIERIALLLDANDEEDVHALVNVSVGQLVTDLQYFAAMIKLLGELRR